jgi:Protein of unknown function (DUF2971)
LGGHTGRKRREEKVKMAEAALDAKEPEVVYHYTSMDTMMKIVHSESIWATSINYLNDVSEGDHFRHLIRRRIPAYVREHPLEDLGILKTFVNTPNPPALDTFAARPCVASFSQDSDSLPQWRSYCPNGNGVAVGFRFDCLLRAFVKPKEDSSGSELPPKPSVTYAKVDYVDSFGVEILDKEIALAVALSKVEGYPVPAVLFKGVIDHIACFKKHPSFSNEREYRLLVNVFGNRSNFEFRATRSTLVPYIPVSIPRRHSRYPDSTEPIMSPLAGRWDFIDRVVVGPAANKNLSLDAVSVFFQRNGMQVEVVPSAIPFRDW